MPTISQLPPATTISASDEIPISQDGFARSAAIGTLLASVQPAISIASPSLLGRTSLGPGGPEQIDLGAGISITGGTLAANGSDHASFPILSTLVATSDLVISANGSPMLMQASELRGLFSAGQNISIDSNGVISATGNETSSSGSGLIALATQPAITSLLGQDLVAVSHSGTNYAITYGNFLDGVTIDQASSASAASDSDVFWVAQGSNVMSSQTFSALWTWIANKLPTFKLPVVEVTTNTTLDATVHNGRWLICSQPIILTPSTTNMGGGFQCSVLNASSGNVVLAASFVTSTGTNLLLPWQLAQIMCASYSKGIIAFANIPGVTAATSVPSQVVGVTLTAVSANTATATWQEPAGGGKPSSYIVAYRQSNSSTWRNLSAGLNTEYQFTGLQSASSYDVSVYAVNSAGSGTASSVVTFQTSNVTGTAPSQVTNVTASAVSNSTIQLTWAAQTDLISTVSFTVQYRATGSSSWLTFASGILGTTTAITGLLANVSYDFEIYGTNSAGAGMASQVVSCSTLSNGATVTSIVWNWFSGNTFTRNTGALGVNAHVSPGTSAIQFALSSSASSRPTSWTTAILINTDLWGAYVPIPSVAGVYYIWAEGLDGSAATVNPAPITVQ